MSIKQLILAAAAFTTVAVHAATVRFKGSAGSWDNTHNIDTPSNWTQSSKPSGAVPETEFSTTNSYVVTSSWSGDWTATRYVNIVKDGSFAGGSLTLNGPVSHLNYRGTYTYSFPEGGLILTRGILEETGGGTGTVGGMVTVAATDSGTEDGAGIFVRAAQASGGILVFAGDLHGAENAYLKINQSGNGTVDYRGIVRFKGDMSDYLGTIRVGYTAADYYREKDGRWGRAQFGDSPILGTVIVRSTGGIGACGAGSWLGETSINNLTFEENGSIGFVCNATTTETIRVTGTLTLPESKTLNLRLYSTAANIAAVKVPVSQPILVAPKGQGLKDANVVLSYYTSADMSSTLACFTTEVKEAGENEVLWLHYSPTGDVLLDEGPYERLTVGPAATLGTKSDGDWFGTASIKMLTLENGAALGFKCDPAKSSAITVTDSLEIKGRIYLMMEAECYASDVVRHIPILTAPKGSGLKDAKVSFAYKISNDKAMVSLGACSYSVEETASNEILYLDISKMTYQAKMLNSANVLNPAYASTWYGMENGDVFPSDLTCLAYDPSKFKCYTGSWPGEVNFTGRGLSLYNQALRLSHRTTIRCDHFTLSGNGWILHSAYTEPFNLYGHLHVLSGCRPYTAATQWSTIQGYLGSKAYIYAPIDGDGNLNILSRKDHEDSQYVGGQRVQGGFSTLYLHSTNTAFSGRMKISNCYDDNDISNTIVHVWHPKSLGGACDVFTYDGVTLAGNSGIVVNDDCDFDELTRGFYVKTRGRISVAADCVAILRAQTTYEGRLVKTGAGVLALGGACRFSSDQLTTPTENLNVLEVSAGAIRPLTTVATDGLEVRMGEGTKLQLPVGSGVDADFAQYGFYDTAWTKPFDLEGCGGRLAVELVGIDELVAGNPSQVSFGVCTVLSDFADVLDGKIDLPKVRGYKATLSTRVNDDDSVTFVAAYEKQGLLLLLR